MKKKSTIIVCLIILIVGVATIVIIGNIMYEFLTTAKVYTYGKEQTIYEILKDDNIDLGDKEYLAEHKYKKAITGTLGSTAKMIINIKNNEIIIIGNRDLIKINNKLYVKTNDI